MTIGKTLDGEVDFVAQKQNDRLYVQVTQEIKSEKTEKREYERLLEIRDNYPKYVLRTDEFAGGNYEGIKSMHIADFFVEYRILTIRAAVSRPFTYANIRLSLLRNQLVGMLFVKVLTVFGLKIDLRQAAHI